MSPLSGKGIIVHFVNVKYYSTGSDKVFMLRCIIPRNISTVCFSGIVLY